MAGTGLQFAPAAHAGALIPGVMPMLTAFLAAVFLGERITALRALGYGMITCGVLVVAGPSLLTGAGLQSLGHGLFLAAALMWASYTAVLRRSGIQPLDATALVAVGSALIVVPIYLWTEGLQLPNAPTQHIILPALFQGVVATILSLVLFGRAIQLLGASAGASFGALTPVLAALLAMPLLGELPTITEWQGIAAICVGVFLASSAPILRALRTAHV